MPYFFHTFLKQILYLYNEYKRSYAYLGGIVQRMIDYAHQLVVLLAAKIHGAQNKVGQQKECHSYRH